MMGKIYRENYHVPFYQVDTMNVMKLPDLMSVLLQLSGKQSESLGKGDDWLFDTYHLVWIITNYQMKCYRLPKYNECLILETQAISYHKFFCYRLFRVFDEHQELLLEMTVTFALLDYTSRQITRVPDDLAESYGIHFADKPLKRSKIPKLEATTTKSYPVRYFDIDRNGHVNNSQYLAWAYDALPFDFLKNHEPDEVQVYFIKEVYYGQVIQSEVLLNGLISNHAIKIATKDAAKIMIKWREKDV